ncbi:hypothetical protein, partial [Aminipila sp.]|uniref:hypothetical protein n=1 Tax=Aminipila sp. TaxID=2060095 RepID=UPI00289D83F0
MKGAGSKLKNLLINPLKIKKYFNNEIMAGFKKYCDIFQRHKDSYIFLTGSGKGDLYILGLYYKEYLESN